MGPPPSATGRRHQLVADTLRQQLQNIQGALAERLPTEAELALRFGVSRGTVRRAYLDLVNEGLVERVPGKGSFPLRRLPYRRAFGTVDELLALSEDTVMEIVDPLASIPDPDAASTLGLQFDEVLRVTYRRLLDTTPFCFTEVFVPPRLGHILEPVDILREPMAQSHATVLGIIDRASPVSGARQSVTAVAAPTDIARLIGCEGSEPVLRIERVHFDGKGHPVELCVNHFNPERYVYRLQLQRH